MMQYFFQAIIFYDLFFYYLFNIFSALDNYMIKKTLYVESLKGYLQFGSHITFTEQIGFWQSFKILQLRRFLLFIWQVFPQLRKHFWKCARATKPRLLLWDCCRLHTRANKERQGLWNKRVILFREYKIIKLRRNWYGGFLPRNTGTRNTKYGGSLPLYKKHHTEYDHGGCLPHVKNTSSKA